MDGWKATLLYILKLKVFSELKELNTTAAQVHLDFEHHPEDDVSTAGPVSNNED